MWFFIAVETRLIASLQVLTVRSLSLFEKKFTPPPPPSPPSPPTTEDAAARHEPLKPSSAIPPYNRH